MDTKKKENVVTNKIQEYKRERVEVYTRARAQKTKVWLNRLSLFLGSYMIISYYWATFTNTGLPFAWVLFVVFPGVGIYLIFKWLWTR